MGLEEAGCFDFWEKIVKTDHLVLSIRQMWASFLLIHSVDCAFNVAHFRVMDLCFFATPFGFGIIVFSLVHLGLSFSI